MKEGTREEKTKSQTVVFQGITHTGVISFTELSESSFRYTNTYSICRRFALF